MPSAPENASGVSAEVRSFMQACSFEATRPKRQEIEGLGRILPQGSLLFLTALPGRPLGELEAAAGAARENGLTPVPHVSARHFATFAEIDRHLSNLRSDRIMLIGGDRATAAGEVPDALSVIESGLFEKHGVTRVYLPGFPDGHPYVDEDQLETNLVTKLAGLQQRGVESEIVTQFCFEPRPILSWLSRLRGRGVHAPVRVGLAGPTTLLKWLGYARRCGVKASAEALAARSGLVRHAFRPMTPDLIIRTVAAARAEGKIENVEPHLFAFGGIEETAQWARAPMTGAIRPNTDGGFDAL